MRKSNGELKTSTPRPPFSLADLLMAADVLYGRQWQAALARDLNLQPRTIQRWFTGTPLADLRERLAELCRRGAKDDPGLEKLARQLERRGPPER